MFAFPAQQCTEDAEIKKNVTQNTDILTDKVTVELLWTAKTVLGDTDQVPPRRLPNICFLSMNINTCQASYIFVFFLKNEFSADFIYWVFFLAVLAYKSVGCLRICHHHQVIWEHIWSEVATPPTFLSVSVLLSVLTLLSIMSFNIDFKFLVF